MTCQGYFSSRFPVMKILIFEWMVGGGLLQDRLPPNSGSSMFQEGLAMVRSICSDLTCAGHSIQLPVDGRIPRVQLDQVPARQSPISESGLLVPVLNQLASPVDAILVIAPECGGRLATALDWLARYSDRIVSPVGEIVRIGSSKQGTVRFLEQAGVQASFEAAPVYPVIVKPDDGAGSDGIHLFENAAAVPQLIWDHPDQWRVERFLPGFPVSISVIGGACGHFLFPPTQQIFGGGVRPDESDRLRPAGLAWPGPWAGFDFPLKQSFARRTVDLAHRALKALPQFSGYLGIDMVLAESGPAEDRIVDLNPRITSSWVGLRQLFSSNLSQFMLDYARGIECETPVATVRQLKYRLVPEQKKGPASRRPR